jgi:hypothetical protein
MKRSNKGLDKRDPHGSRGGSRTAPAAVGCKRVLLGRYLMFSGKSRELRNTVTTSTVPWRS